MSFRCSIYFIAFPQNSRILYRLSFPFQVEEEATKRGSIFSPGHLLVSMGAEVQTHDCLPVDQIALASILCVIFSSLLKKFTYHLYATLSPSETG